MKLCKNSVFSGFLHQKFGFFRFFASKKPENKPEGNRNETGNRTRQDKNEFQFLKTRQDKTGIGSIPV